MFGSIRTPFTDRTIYRDTEDVAWLWRMAALGAGLGRSVDTVSGVTESVPRLTNVEMDGGQRVYTVELLHGQMPADVRVVSHRIAPSLGAYALRVEARGFRHVRITLLACDPLLGAVARAPGGLYSATSPVMLGRDEEASRVDILLGESAHMIVQGAAGSGKSTGVYGMLAQLTDARDALVVGSDIHGLTLRPWADRAADKGWHALGTRDLHAHLRVLERATRIMDDRIAEMPPGVDSTPISAACPLIIVVAEEVPGLFRVLGQTNRDLEKRARALIARLLGEGRKAGIRVLLIAQRADANIIGGYERGQASHTVSFRVDSKAALQMLHSDVDTGIAAEHSTARPGVALLSAPGVPLRRFRTPPLSYATYVAEVAHGAAQGQAAA